MVLGNTKEYLCLYKLTWITAHGQTDGRVAQVVYCVHNIAGLMIIGFKVSFWFRLNPNKLKHFPHSFSNNTITLFQVKNVILHYARIGYSHLLVQDTSRFVLDR